MTMNEASAAAAASAVPVPELIRAYNETKADFEATPESKKVFMNLEVSGFAYRVLAHAAAIESLEAEAKSKVVDFDPALFRTVRQRALGMLQAHSLHTFAATPVTDELPAHMERATALRAKMIDSAQYLVRQGELPPSSLEPIKNQTGYRITATDLIGLSNLYRAQRHLIGGKCAVTAGDIDEAATLAGCILDAMAAREDSERHKTETGELRHKAYSVVFHQYDEIRRIVSFLRWHEGDAEDFAPSLFSGRRSGNAKDRGSKDRPSDHDTLDGAAPTDGKPVAATGGQVAPVAGPPVAPFASVPVVPYGQPGGSPFLR